MEIKQEISDRLNIIGGSMHTCACCLEKNYYLNSNYLSKRILPFIICYECQREIAINHIDLIASKDKNVLISLAGSIKNIK